MADNTLSKLLTQIDTLKKELDTYRPLPKELLKNLIQWYRVELSYTSNALEGNTLTASETALVIEKGLTIGGKPLKDHLEAINHAFAFDYVVELAQKTRQQISLSDIYAIHSLILKGIDSGNAGQLRKVAVRITGLEITLAEPIKLPDLMEEFIIWLHTTDEHPVLIAAEAHLKLVTIHPFIDGNGRTSRLLMNLLLMQEGYPPAVIKPADRNTYIDSLATAQRTGNTADFLRFIAECCLQSLKSYLDQAKMSI